MFEEPGNLDKFFTQERVKSRLKAIDSKLFGHAFPLMAKRNLGMHNIHSEILGLLNTYYVLWLKVFLVKMYHCSRKIT